MSIVGTVDSLRRYPVKSMNGEESGESFLGFPGVYCAVLVEEMVKKGDPVEVMA